MNKNIIKALAGVAVMLSACDYNEDNFEGLDELVNEAHKNIVSENYTLTADDYTAIAKYSKDELGNLASSQAFDNADLAKKYIPNFLSSKYYTVDIKSAVNVTFNVLKETTDTYTQLNKTASYTVSSDDYVSVWGNEKVKYLTPATTGNVAGVLSKVYPNAVAGQYVAVTYKYDANEPVVAGEAAPATYVMTDKFEGEGKYVIAAKVGDGYIPYGLLKDESKAYGYFVGDAISAANGTISLADAESYVMTVAKTANGYSLQRPDGKFIYMAGSYDSFNLGDYPEEGGDWTFTAVSDGMFNVVNVLKSKCVKYDTGYNSYGCYASTKYEGKDNYIDVNIFKLVEPDNAGNQDVIATAPETVFALYKFDGKKWAVTTDASFLSAADYKAMGQKYTNLSETASPAVYLPNYLSAAFPYALEGDEKTVAYYYYNGKTTSVRADLFTFSEGKWSASAKSEVTTMQYVKNSKGWAYDPSVVITLPKSSASTAFYQTATDWVWENVDQAMGITVAGQGYMTSYKNNEYYTGSSAYQNNVDWRAGSARAQYPAGYGEMTDAEIVEQMKKNLIEVYAHVLAKLYPEANVVEGIDVTYTINFIVYTGSNADYQIIYKVVGKGQFEYVEGSLQEVK
ncbi:MAG: hypothetical protein MJZ18_06640 [Bacteroidales bacterium]|nr:hypothetical protein [Bacteroidales bacterium]